MVYLKEEDERKLKPSKIEYYFAKVIRELRAMCYAFFHNPDDWADTVNADLDEFLVKFETVSTKTATDSTPPKPQEVPESEQPPKPVVNAKVARSKSIWAAMARGK